LRDAAATSGDPAAPRRLICARCGRAFDCGLGRDCWCAAPSFRLPPPPPAADACVPRAWRRPPRAAC